MSENSKEDEITLEAIERMAVIAEHGLPNVKNHIWRMRGYAYILAKHNGMTDEEANDIANACMLHDVGMVSVPRSIVSKASNLSNEEWEIVKQHPAVGADILDEAIHDVFKIAKTVALSHHERWDGSGYPLGLKGENIPLVGRICGLCDVFDTLTHPRAYKTPMSADEVLLLLQESSETFFDPKLVDSFTVNYEEIISVRNKYQ